jgi:hypothetical protein
MKPGRTIDVASHALVLQPGENRVTFSAENAEGFPGDVNVLYYRLKPL